LSAGRTSHRRSPVRGRVVGRSLTGRERLTRTSSARSGGSVNGRDELSSSSPLRTKRQDFSQKTDRGHRNRYGGKQETTHLSLGISRSRRSIVPERRTPLMRRRISRHSASRRKRRSGRDRLVAPPLGRALCNGSTLRDEPSCPSGPVLNRRGRDELGASGSGPVSLDAVGLGVLVSVGRSSGSGVALERREGSGPSPLVGFVGGVGSEGVSSSTGSALGYSVEQER
jgi:hypothetical protein